MHTIKCRRLSNADVTRNLRDGAPLPLARQRILRKRTGPVLPEECVFLRPKPSPRPTQRHLAMRIMQLPRVFASTAKRQHYRSRMTLGVGNPLGFMCGHARTYYIQLRKAMAKRFAEFLPANPRGAAAPTAVRLLRVFAQCCDSPRGSLAFLLPGSTS